MNNEIDNKRIQELEDELKTLRNDFAEASKSLKEMAEKGGQQLEGQARRTYYEAAHRANELWDNLSSEGDDIIAMLSDKFKAATSHIESSAKSHPAATIGLIAGVSLLVGYLSKSK